MRIGDVEPYSKDVKYSGHFTFHYTSNFIRFTFHHFWGITSEVPSCHSDDRLTASCVPLSYTASNPLCNWLKFPTSLLNRLCPQHPAISCLGSASLPTFTSYAFCKPPNYIQHIALSADSAKKKLAWDIKHQIFLTFESIWCESVSLAFLCCFLVHNCLQ